MSRRKLDRALKWLLLIWMLLSLLLFATLMAAQRDGSPTNENTLHGARTTSVELIQFPAFPSTSTALGGLPFSS